MIKIENYPNTYKKVYAILKHTNEKDVKKKVSKRKGKI